MANNKKSKMYVDRNLQRKKSQICFLVHLLSTLVEQFIPVYMSSVIPKRTRECFRKDVIDLIRELNVSSFAIQGETCFGYNREDMELNIG